MTIRIGFLLVHLFPMYVVMLAVEILRLANKHAKARAFDWSMIGESGEPVSASNGIRMDCDAVVGELIDWSYVFVVAGDDQPRRPSRTLRNWLTDVQRDPKTQLGAIDSGAFILAAARLIQSRAVTVHPDSLNAFCEQYPRVQTKAMPFIQSERLLTCAGGLATVSLMLMIIERHCGVSVRTSVARDLIVDGERAGYQDSAKLPLSNDAAIDVVTEKMKGSLEEPMSLADLADAAQLSSRRVSRLFQEYFGCGPIAYYRRLRLYSARQLILQSDMAISSVAVATGFQSVSAFSRAFSHEFGHSPRSALTNVRREGNASTVPPENYTKQMSFAKPKGPHTPRG